MFDVPESTLDALEEVERILQQNVDDGTRVGKAALGTISAGGKRLRPLLVLLSCEAAGGTIDERVLRVAAGVELIHTASLVHDDIMDDANLRRGEPTIAAEHGANRAIVAGDFLFVKGYELAATALDAESVRLVAEACSGLAEGQYEEETLKADPTDRDEYFYVVERKTAGFIAACAELGAHLAGADAAQRAVFRDFGYNLGVAFQLVDDVLDATGTIEATGKDVRNDVRNGAKGGPVVFALQNAHSQLGRLVAELVQEKGVDETKSLASEFAERASKAVDRMPAGEHTTTLRQVAQVLLHRDR